MNSEASAEGLFESLPEQSILIEGMAGSGKSQLIAAQAVHYARQVRCLVLSFSRAGEQVLRNYTRRLCADELPLLHLCTVDGLASDLLRRLEDQRPIRSRDQVLDEDMSALLADACARMPAEGFTAPVMSRPALQQLLSNMEYFRNALAFEAADDLECEQICQGNVNAEPALLRTLYALYENYRRRWLPEAARSDHYQGAAVRRKTDLGFRMLGDAIIDLFEYPPEAWHKRLEPFRYIFIDEFHDITPLQLKFIEQLAAPETQLMAVGDRHQNIYGWRAADTDVVFEGYCRHFDAVVLQQRQSHRFGQNLADFCAAVTGCAYRSSAKHPTVIEAGRLQDYVSAQTSTLRSTAVVAQNYARLYEAVFTMWMLTQGRLTMSFGLVSNLVVSLLNILYALRQRRFLHAKMGHDVRRFLESACCTLSYEGREEVLEQLTAQKFLSFMDRFLAPSDAEMPGLTPAFKEALQRCLQSSLSPADCLAVLAQQGNILGRQQAMAQPYEFTILELLQAYLRQQQIEFEQWPNVYSRLLGAWHKGRGCQCLTVAGAKGHEFDTVMVYAADQEGFVGKGRAGNRERNEFYVACSRARKKLVLLAPEGQGR